MITAGPTFESIDPVRFIGNHSSGKMGFSIALEAAKKGARVKTNNRTNFSKSFTPSYK